MIKKYSKGNLYTGVKYRENVIVSSNVGKFSRNRINYIKYTNFGEFDFEKKLFKQKYIIY